MLDLDHLSDDEREDAYAACDVFCLPSEAEAFGLVVLEAWAYGKPVVVSDIPTLRERVEPAGGVTTARRPHDVAVALARLLTDVDLRSRLGSAGRAIAGLSSWQSTARSMVALYREGGACAHMHEADQETTNEGSSRRSPALDG